MPVVGTAIGAAIGFFAGKLFAPDINEVRTQCLPEIRSSINNLRVQTHNSTKKSYNEAVQYVQNEFSDIISLYMDKYEKLVNKMIKQDRKKAIELKRLNEQSVNDMSELKLRKENLINTETKIRNL